MPTICGTPEICVEVARTSDALVLVLGQELSPTTRKEYEAAKAAETHCFIYQDQRVEPDDAVQAFIKAERAGAITGKFSNAKDLSEKAVGHLAGLGVSLMREETVRRRRVAAAAVGRPVVEDRTTAWSEPPPRRKYEEQQVAFGESPDKPETFRTVAGIVAEQRELAEQGEYYAAFTELRDLAFELYERGRADLALEVLTDLRSIVSPGRVGPAEDAWLLNVQALALARLGKDADADKLWMRLLAVGERLGDKHMRAIAMQNLATTATNAGNLPAAKKHVLGSIELMTELGETRSILQLLNNLALIAIEEKDYERATEELDVYEQMARVTEDLYLMTSARGNRGRLLAAQGQFEAAECEFRAALRCARETGDPLSQVLGLQNLGAVCVDTDRLGPAMRWYRKAIRLAETVELPVQVEVLRRSLAGVLHRAERNREAIAEFDRAREVAWELGDQGLWAQSTTNLGAAYLLSGDASAAMEPLEKAASTFRELGDLEWELRAQRNIAAAKVKLGETGPALDVLERALPLLSADAHEERAALLREAAETGLADPDLLARTVDLFERALGEEIAYLGPVDVARRAATVASFLSQAGAQEAVPFYDRAVALLEDVASVDYSLAHAINDRAVGLERLGRHDDSRGDLLRCLELVADGADDVLRQKALANLSEVERQLGDIPAAVDAARAAVALARQMRDDEAITHAIGNLSLALEEDDRPDEADAALSELQALADAQDVPAWKARAASGFGRVAFLRGEYDRAADEYRRAADIYRGTDAAALVGALGGLLESLGRAGERRGLRDTAQELVDMVLTGTDPDLIISYLGRTGISWLQLGELEEGSSLLGAGVLVGARELGGAGPRPQDIEEGIRPLSKALCYTVLASQGSHRFEEDTVYDTVVEYINNHEAGVGDALRPSLQMAREAMESRKSGDASTSRVR